MLRILRDLCNRVPTWAPLKGWVSTKRAEGNLLTSQTSFKGCSSVWTGGSSALYDISPFSFSPFSFSPNSPNFPLTAACIGMCLQEEKEYEHLFSLLGVPLLGKEEWHCGELHTVMGLQQNSPCYVQLQLFRVPCYSGNGGPIRPHYSMLAGLERARYSACPERNT